MFFPVEMQNPVSCLSFFLYRVPRIPPHGDESNGVRYVW